MEVDISGAKVFFTIPIDFPLFGKIQISETLVVSWIVMALITGLCIWLTRDLKIRNISKRQAVAEMIVETANKFVIGNMGEKFRYLIPVSYTHLDVYKRQEYPSQSRGSRTSVPWRQQRTSMKSF